MPKPRPGDELRECATVVGLASASGVTVASKWSRVIRDAASALDTLAADLARAREPVGGEVVERVCEILLNPTDDDLYPLTVSDECRNLTADLARAREPWGDGEDDVLNEAALKLESIAEAHELRDGPDAVTEHWKDLARGLRVRLRELHEPVGDEVVEKAVRNLKCQARRHGNVPYGETLAKLAADLRTHARQQAERIAGLEAQKVPEGLRVVECDCCAGTGDSDEMNLSDGGMEPCEWCHGNGKLLAAATQAGETEGEGEEGDQ